MLWAPERVTQTVKEGYIPFDQEAPPRVDLENNRSSQKDSDFVWQELLCLECFGHAADTGVGDPVSEGGGHLPLPAGAFLPQSNREGRPGVLQYEAGP